MKQYWQKIATRIDALSLRERAIIFVLASVLLLSIFNMFLLDPLFARQNALSASLRVDQAKIADAQQQIQNMIRQRTGDPDAAGRKRLQALTSQSLQTQAALEAIQSDLVSPDKMAGLLENILRRNGNLRLVSLKTLPPSSLNGAAIESSTEHMADAAPALQNKNATPAPEQPAGLVFRHGVEITVQGNYLDMVDYVKSLEAMPAQLYWGKAVLNAEEHTKATLSLTLFTLSLDKRWLNI